MYRGAIWVGGDFNMVSWCIQRSRGCDFSRDLGENRLSFVTHLMFIALVGLEHLSVIVVRRAWMSSHISIGL